MKNLILLVSVFTLLFSSCGDGIEYPSTYTYAGYDVQKSEVAIGNGSTIVEITELPLGSNFVGVFDAFVASPQFPGLEQITLMSDSELTVTSSEGETSTRIYDQQGAILNISPTQFVLAGTDSLEAFLTLEAIFDQSAGYELAANFTTFTSLLNSADQEFENRGLVEGDTLSLTVAKLNFVK